MARTPIPPSATAVRKRGTSQRRSRCVMLAFSCFLPLETGIAGLVLTVRTPQRYKIFAPPATAAKRTRNQALAATHCSRAVNRPRRVVEAEHGGYTVALWGCVLYARRSLINFRRSRCLRL